MRKKSARANVKKMVAFAVLILLLIYAFFASERIYKKAHEKKEEAAPPKGRLVFWDVSLPTVTGSKYAFIDTITDEYCEERRGVSVSFNKISERSPEETIALNSEGSNRPDIIRSKVGAYSADSEKALTDSEIAASLKERYLPFINNAYGDKIILDVCYDVSVIIINTELLGRLNLAMPENISSPEGFVAFLNEAKASDKKGEYEIIGFDKNDVYSYLPFLLCGESPDEKLLDEVMPLCSSSETPRTDFYNGKCLMFCGSLDEAAYITRRSLAGKGFDFALMNYPSEKEEFIFIRDILSYTFYEPENKSRRKLLLDFACYFLSEDALKYTENLGKLCTVKNGIAYERYPYLKAFTDERLLRYCYRDEHIAQLADTYINYFK